MKKPFFTIIIVSYNPGEKLFETIRSVEKQNFTDYRILIKDGMSTDGSIDKLKIAYDIGIAGEDEGKVITLLESCDNGIYHGMNIATAFLEGKIKVLFEDSVEKIFAGSLCVNKNILTVINA